MKDLKFLTVLLIAVLLSIFSVSESLYAVGYMSKLEQPDAAASKAKEAADNALPQTPTSPPNALDGGITPIQIVDALNNGEIDYVVPTIKEIFETSGMRGIEESVKGYLSRGVNRNSLDKALRQAGLSLTVASLNLASRDTVDFSKYREAETGIITLPASKVLTMNQEQVEDFYQFLAGGAEGKVVAIIARDGSDIENIEGKFLSAGRPLSDFPDRVAYRIDPTLSDGAWLALEALFDQSEVLADCTLNKLKEGYRKEVWERV